MKQVFFTIDSKTNIHVGSGKSNYGVIDNLVQRDPTFQHPIIHASSLKGGIKEYCHHNHRALNMVKIFGSEKDASNGKTKHDNSQTGAYKFFDALLLCMPVRCDKRAFVHITCPRILEYLAGSLPEGNTLKSAALSLAAIFTGAAANVQAYCFSSSLHNAIIEDFSIKATFDNNKGGLLIPELKSLFNNNELVILRNELFDRLTNDLHLPVVARNYLENGESKNLWYEQVVPRLSRFWSLALYQGEDELFEPVLFKAGGHVQLGANGSVGYGYCSFNKL